VTNIYFRDSRDVLNLRHLAGIVEIIERSVGGDGPPRYQLLAPRGPNEWVTRALQEAPLRLFPDGSIEFGCHTDPAAREGLRGTWEQSGQQVRLRAQGQMPAASEAWLDGHLSPSDEGRDEAWSLDALFSGGSGVSRVLARVRHTMAASMSRQEPELPGRPDSPASSRSSQLAPAISVFDTLWPVFDVTVTAADGFGDAPSRPAVLILSDPAKNDDHRAPVTLACEGPLGAGWIAWVASLSEEAARLHVNRVEVRSPPGELPSWYAQDMALPVPLRGARLCVEYSPADFTIEGTVTAVGIDGTRYSAELRGRLRSPAVEAMRLDLAQLGLSGTWEGVLGPASTARLPGGVHVAGHGDLNASAGGELTRAGSGEPYGFLRHARAQDLAVGLAGPVRQESLILLSRRDAPVSGLAEPGPNDTAALRFLAQAALIDGLTATARPLMDRAAALLVEETQDAWISRALLLNYQVQAEFELRDYRRLISHLRAAVTLRRKLLVEASPWAWARRIITEQIASSRSTLEAFPPGVARIDTAARVLDSVDRVAAVEAAGAVLTPQGIGELVDALLTAVRSATASLRELSQAELADNEALLGPDLAALRSGLVEAAVIPAPEDPARLAEVRADLEEREARLRSAVGGRQDVDDGQRQAYLHSYVIAVILRGLAFSLEVAAQPVERSDLPAFLEQRITSSRQGLTYLTGYIEQWRSLFMQDADRIQAVEGSQGFYADLVRFLLGLDAPREAFLASELARARAFADLLRKPDRSASPQAPPAVPTVEALVAACVESRHTVVEYFLLEDEVVAWLVAPTGEIQVYRSPASRTDLANAITELHTLLTAGRPTAHEQGRTGDLLQQLGDQLWRPLPPDALPRDPDEPVVIVPHGPLFRVPFAALRDAEGRHLVENHALILAPAAAMLPQLLDRRRQGRPQARQRCLAMVSPSPMPLSDLRELTQVTAEQFHPIAAFYQPDGCVIHQGTDATWSAFRQDATDADVLIFATHAEALDAPGTDPMNSYIALAPTPGHDGLLRARDILGLDLSAQVAILSACSTGAGRVTGDGLIGLSRAFMTAGPSTLLMTLYETGELISLDLMYRFHTHWKGAGATAASALRRALCELHQESRGKQPHLWAPFVLFGLDTTSEEA